MKVKSLVEVQPMTSVVYTHKHGTDVYPCLTPEAAEEVAKNTALEYADDFYVDREQFTPQEMVDNWMEITGGQENIEIVSGKALELIEREIDDLLFSEFTPEEHNAFMQHWIKSYAKSLEVEADFSETEAKERAELDWENYMGQEGYTQRDEEIMFKREARLLQNRPD